MVVYDIVDVVGVVRPGAQLVGNESKIEPLFADSRVAADAI